MTALYYERRKASVMMYEYYCKMICRFFDKLYENEDVDIRETNRKIRYFQKKAEKVRKHIRCLDRKFLGSL